MKQFLFIVGILCLLVSCKEQGGYNKMADKKVPKIVDYNFDVRPILSDKCFNCHGPDVKKRYKGLRLDTQEGAYSALKGSTTAHGIVPNKPMESEAYLRIISKDTTQLMPPLDSNLKLSGYEKKVIKKWIDQGAKYDTHWAFKKVEKPALPESAIENWGVNEIDDFVAKKLEENNLTPNERADKERLLKRVAFDITGLPPSLKLQEQFLNDLSENAYEKVVDQLLASKHYGEKMASDWMDVARYADSHGYQDDQLRTMWPWRDWVIHAYNENYSYEKFVTYQLAGDMIPEKNIETVLASGFNRNHKISQEGGIIREETRIENVTDRTNTFGKAFLGMTFECAKCHDHKYDPISQKDYYQTFAFFDRVPFRENNEYAGNKVFAVKPKITINDSLVANELSFINKMPKLDVEVMVMEERPNIRKTYILDRGAYDAKTDTVESGTPASILPFDKTKYQPNRYGLTKWMFDENNPLTSRVYVNRIWQNIFGRGIVNTSGDFGMQGELPTHADLLNWLSADFMEHHWDIKHLVKKIVMSATYQQSSVVSKEKMAIDPDNMYLARSSRNRFTAEMIRDHALASSGLLFDDIGGRSVRVYQPDGLWESATSGRGHLTAYTQDKGELLYKRGLYIFVKRTSLPPVQTMFDGTAREQCEVRRQSTMTPLQALIRLNDPTILEASRVFSEKLSKEKLAVNEKIEKAFRSILCRNMKAKEKEILEAYYQEQLEYFNKHKEEASEFVNVGEYAAAKGRNDVEVASLMQIIHTMYNMEETIVKS
ncbi:PSD1 and planctomycete cytochrome C domain-containing protein [Wenyingzhuangia sp. IMCC45574]